MDAEALASAIARWGSTAVVHRETLTISDGSPEGVSFERFSVGCLGHDAFSWSAHGVAASWEAAFADADRREHKRRTARADLGIYATADVSR